MNCQEALNLLYDIIDKEASEIDEKAVREHIEHCRHCSEIYRVESVVNEFLHAKLQKNVPGPELDGLKSKILTQLDDVDGARHSGKKKIPFRTLSLTLAAAASLVLLVSVAFLASDFYKHQTDNVPLEQAHWAASGAVAEFADAVHTSSTLDHILTDFHYELSAEIDNFRLIGGNTREIMGVQMGQFLYGDGDRFVSVFVAPASEFAIPSEVMDNAVVHDNVNYYDHFCRGCRLVYHKVGDVVVVTATTEKDVELLDFIPGHSAI
jgi:anti-sigma factor (TIGR02949 family)